jgi:hypothetical protein
MAAKEAWQGLNNVALAREILEAAFGANPESEQIWLAACKVEAEQHNLDAARVLMDRARQVANTERVRPAVLLYGLVLYADASHRSGSSRPSSNDSTARSRRRWRRSKRASDGSRRPTSST